MMELFSWSVSPLCDVCGAIIIWTILLGSINRGGNEDELGAEENNKV